MSKPFCLWGCGEFVNPPKIKRKGGSQGVLFSRPKGVQARYPFVRILSNHALVIGTVILRQVERDSVLKTKTF